MLTLFLAYGAYRNARSANRILQTSPDGMDAARNVLLVSYGLMLLILWPLLIPAAVIRYAPNRSPLPAFILTAIPLLSLIFLGVEFYFVYSLVFLVTGFNFTISALENIEHNESQENQESSSNS